MPAIVVSGYHFIDIASFALSYNGRAAFGTREYGSSDEYLDRRAIRCIRRRHQRYFHRSVYRRSVQLAS